MWFGQGLHLVFAMYLHEYEIPPDVLFGWLVVLYNWNGVCVFIVAKARPGAVCAFRKD